jgi:hypothetical protein
LPDASRLDDQELALDLLGCEGGFGLKWRVLAAEVARIFFGEEREEHRVFAMERDEAGPGSGKEAQTQAWEVFEVLVQRDEGNAVTSGEGGEVGSHPSFRRGGRSAGAFLPVGGDAGGGLRESHLRQVEVLLPQGPGLLIG